MTTDVVIMVMFDGDDDDVNDDDEGDGCNDRLTVVMMVNL